MKATRISCRPLRAPSRVARAAVVVVALCAIGCGQADPVAPTYPTDPAGGLFEPDHLLDVRIEIAPGDWDALRSQSRTWWDIVIATDGNCLGEPFRKPFTYFPASITVDGVRRENVGVRQKGFLGSVDGVKPALKVNINEYEPDQRLYGLSQLTLNNSKQDASFVKQCLAYKVFADAGIPSPRCNYARVRVNDRDMGLYVNVEDVGRDFLRRHFEDESGDLWEGEFSDFRDDWFRTFEKKTNLDGTPQARVDRSALQGITAAVRLGSPDDLMLEQLSAAVDVDQFLDFWATEVILEHWDGYANNANNFFIYEDPRTERFVFMPWGTDQIMVTDPFTELKPPHSVFANGIVARRLYTHPEIGPRYVNRMRELLDSVWHEDALLREVDRLQGLALPVVADAGGDVDDMFEALAEVREFIAGRRAVLLADLADKPRAWELPMRSNPCVRGVGDLEGSFATAFGTDEPDYPATLSGGLYGRPLSLVWVGSHANLDENEPVDPWPVVRMVATDRDGLVYVLWIGVRPERFVPGGSARFEDGDAWGGIGTWNNATRQWRYVGGFIDGGIELDQATALEGAPVSGRFRTRVVAW